MEQDKKLCPQGTGYDKIIKKEECVGPVKVRQGLLEGVRMDGYTAFWPILWLTTGLTL